MQLSRAKEKLSRPQNCPSGCPGCGHEDLSYEESLSRKLSWINHCLRVRVVRDVFPAPISWKYRKKSLLHARIVNGAWQFGLIKKNQREEFFWPIPDCPAQTDEVNEAFKTMAGLIPLDWPLKFILVSGDCVTLILKSTRREDICRFVEKWSIPYSLFICWNPVAGKRAIDSRRIECISGKYWSQEDNFWYGPTTFSQQIPALDAFSKRIAVDHFDRVSTVVDLYCGTGKSLYLFSRAGADVCGVELYGESVEAAKRNCPEATILRRKVVDRLPQIDQWLAGKSVWHLYVNPPRLGLGSTLCEWILEKMPVKIAYLSCNPKSMADDLDRLDAKYKVTSIQALDFFPRTKHIEVLACLELLR